MKAYGLPRLPNVAFPDVFDAVRFGRATASYAVPGRGGDVRAYHSLRGGAKAAARRTYKRAARAEGRALCREF